MDPLEDVLALTALRSSVSSGLVAGGDWAMRFPPPAGVKFVAVRSGTCRLSVVGDDVQHDLSVGDCCLLTRPEPFLLGSDLTLPAADAHAAFLAAGDGLARAGTGDGTFVLGGSFDFGERAHDLLLDALPPVIVVPAASDAARTVEWALAEIEREVRGRPFGARLVAEHLATVMLVHVLRLHLAREPHGRGLLAGLTDPVAAAALHAMHGRPAAPWTVAGLAAVAGVSRSTLAARFTDAVGQPPLEYLTRWRVALAARELRGGTRTLAAIATAVGYGSESALSTAFKRVVGTSPRDYRGARPA